MLFAEEKKNVKPIPVNTPLLGGNEQAYLQQCLETGWISSEGPFVQQFEEEFSSYVQRKEGIAVANGSAALDIAVQALQLQPGDEVIMPAFTIISPAFSILRAGAVPVLVDSDPHTWNMTAANIAQKITAKTKAILVVHIYGLPVDMDEVLSLAKQHQLWVVEDAAEMHGQTYKGKKCGSFGHVSTFSFYPNKLITTGEGGMIVTDDPQLAARCRKLRNLAFEPDGRRFIHYEMGWNYRMTNLQAALGLAQLEKIEEHIRLKREAGARYQQGLAALEGYQLPLHKTEFAENIYWVFGMVAADQQKADSLVARLQAARIGTRPFFWPMHEQPVFREMGLFKGESYPVAEHLARAGFYLPSGLGLTAEDGERVIEAVLQYA
jgi:perosamine synthetase